MPEPAAARTMTWSREKSTALKMAVWYLEGVNAWGVVDPLVKKDGSAWILAAKRVAAAFGEMVDFNNMWREHYHGKRRSTTA